MSFLKKIVVGSFLAVLFAASLFANENCRTFKQIELRASVLGMQESFENKTLFFGTYVFFENGVQVDQGFYTDLVKPLGTNNDNCNGNSFNNEQLLILYGVNGIAEVFLEGKTALGRNNRLRFVHGSGVYCGLERSNNVTIIANCPAAQDQFILQARVSVK